MNILHAATDPDLLTRLKQMLGSASRADIAVGYFFVSGFDAVADELSQLGEVRILVGRTDRPTLEAVALGLQQQDALRARLNSDSMVQRSQREVFSQDAVDSIATGVSVLPQTDDTQQAVAKLREMIGAGFLEIRAYPRGLLHAKAYLCWYDSHAEPGAAIVGSSNFTLAGFTGNTELNVRVTGDAEMAELSRWFDALWADSVDITDALTVELDRSWAIARTPPYYVYLKALYELYGSGVSDDPDLPLSTGPVDLANFQIDAVRWGLNTTDRYGGCYIGDVVGLGKTYIGAELLRQLKQSYPRDGNPVIICPAGLVPMWQQVNERYQLGAAVVSQSVIAPPAGAEFDEELERYVDVDTDTRGVVLADEYPNRGTVLVDEAHNFRNINRRSEGLRDYLGNGDHKVVLMSATPQNLGPRDIYRQLRFFLDETQHGLNIEPVRLEDYFRSAELWHGYRMEQEDYRARLSQWRRGGRKGDEPQPPATPRTPRASVEEVLTPVFIRRRRDLRELYGDTATVNGQPVRFPNPVLGNLEYRLDRVCAKAGPFDELQDLLRQHLASRYRATDYLTEEAARKDEYRDLLRSRGRIAGLIRALVLKRLESSIEAFRSTVNALIGSNRNFRAALESEYVPIGNTATRMLAGSDFDADELLAVLQKEEQRRQESGQRRATLIHSTTDFEIDQWLDDLDEDHETLTEIRERIKEIGPEDDDKLHSLERFLSRPEVERGKALIFSESEITINYLFEQLNPGGKHSDIARLSGSVSRDGAANIIRRFSPISHLPSRIPWE